MKKLIYFTILTLCLCFAFAGDVIGIYRVNNSTEQFGRVLPAGTLIYDREGKTLYQLKEYAIATATILTSTVTEADSAIVGTLSQAARDSAEQVWIDSLGQANVVIPNDLTVHGEISVDDTLHIDGFRLHGDGDYLSFYGRDGGEKYQYYFYNGVSLGNDFEFYDGDLNMQTTAGDGNINLGYGSGLSDTLRWGSGSTYVGKLFQKIINGRPYLTIENTGIRLNSSGGETWVADSLQVDGYIYGGDNAHIDGNLEIGGLFTLPEGGYFESIGTDTTAVVDAVFKSQGKFASMGGYFMDNGFSIVPTSATKTTLS